MTVSTWEVTAAHYEIAILELLRAQAEVDEFDRRAAELGWPFTGPTRRQDRAVAEVLNARRALTQHFVSELS